MLVKVYGSAVFGVDAMTITMEVDSSQGVTQYSIVGLPDSAVKESLFRIVSGLRNSGIDRPRAQILINMSPADIKKEGAAYDLPIAVGMLAVSGIVPAEHLSDYVIMGEMGLDGAL